MENSIFLAFLGHASLGLFILKMVLNAAALFGATFILRGVYIKDFTGALILALVLAFLNGTLGALLNFFATPLTWLTLGLFAFVVDAVVLMVADYFMKSFKIKSFIWALALAVVLAVFNGILHFIFL